jgi:peptide/nickel transport system ATP-binding protein
MEQVNATIGRKPLLRVEDLIVEYSLGGRPIHAVSGVTLEIARGETLGLVGESGCGKSTLARAVLQLGHLTSGRVLFAGIDLTALGGAARRKMRRHVQIIFQDPIASLNPRRRVGDIVGEPLLVAGVRDKDERDRRVRKVLSAVGLDPDLAMARFPHEFSGGQCQRISIARALILEPELIVCDEPVSSLDVSIRAQILNLLEEMKARYGLTLLFIAHDLAVVKAVSDRVAVMYLGKMMEMADRNEIYENPLHPYTKALLSAVPVPDPALERKRERIILTGDVPSSLRPPRGCVFHTRCPIAIDECREVIPEWREVTAGHWVACHRV